MRFGQDGPRSYDGDMQDVQEVHALLARTPGVLRSLMAMAPPDAMAFREAPGNWNPLEVLRHVTDAEVHDWMPRIEIILSGSRNPFTPFDREAGLARYDGWTLDALLRELERLRRDNLDRLSGFGMTASDLERVGMHPELGEVTLRQLLACWVTHDLAHVAQISRVLVRYFGQEVGPWRAYFSLLRQP
jgi:uncharacterized damage-inducible protein DinB